MQRLVSPENTPPNQSFYLTLTLSTETLDIVPFSVALEPSSKILSRNITRPRYRPF
jgi:hypothetical protein